MPALALVIIGCTMLLLDAIDHRGTRIGKNGSWLVAVGFVLIVLFYH